MVIQKTAVYKILAIVLALLLLVGSSERVEAADEVLTGTFEYEGVSYPYYYTNHVYSLTYASGVKGYYHVDFSSSVYMLFVKGTDNYPYALAVSDEPFTVKCTYVNNGTIVRDCGTQNASSTTINGKSYYYRTEQLNVNQSYDIPAFQTSYSYAGNLMNPFLTYFSGDSFDDLLFSPNWNAVNEDSLLYIRNMQASIADDNITIVWDELPHLPYKLMNHIYIRFSYTNKTPGTTQSLVARRKYKQIEQYANMKDCEIVIPISDLNIPEGDIITSIHAQPYYYKADDVNNDTIKGNATIIYFDEEGNSSIPIEVSPDIQDEIPIENTEQNIFYSIQNFFSGFFRNLTNTIKSAVVPSGDDVLALLQEMNDWFSERFGFIWYPFDLAIDIMAAFALGEPDSKITVPALTLNMLGGIKLWDSFEADLDPIGFMQYVRFFTSAIMCCGTVSLAIRKWDEWIGGEH